MWPFAPSQPVQECPKACADAKAKDDELAKAARLRADDLLAQQREHPGARPSRCQEQAASIGQTANEFQTYSNALPSARAAQNMNALGDSSPDGAKETPVGPCLERMPLDAAALNAALGLPPGTITNKMLRDDKSGFRAALFRDQATGKLILVPRDTEPHSLVDWRTNIDNGLGEETPQYKAMETLTKTLHSANTDFDIAGYSKGGGLAQVGGLSSPDSIVNVFNSAGISDSWAQFLPMNAMSNLESRTTAFSAQGDFLTMMNDTTGHEANLDNMTYLYNQLSGNVSPLEKFFLGGSPIQINYLNPQSAILEDDLNSADALGVNTNYLEVAKDNQVFQEARSGFLQQLQGIMQKFADDPNAKSLFPPVRAGSFNTIPHSMSLMGRLLGAGDKGPSLGHLAQHQISNVVAPMENVVKKDRSKLQRFMQSCG
ncbi:hypothetical protein ACOSOMT5_P0458 [Acidiphilium sp. MT5]